jgi:hypothetical protein
MATNAYRDENSVPTMIGVLNTDGVTVTRIYANPSNNSLKVGDSNIGTDHGTANAKRDENDVPCLMAVSSSDGVTPVALYVDSSNNLLIQST